MAIGKIFDLDGDKIIPKSDCYIIKSLRRIIDDFPDTYGLVFAYLHYMKSFSPDDNPFADVPLAERSEKIIFELDLDIDPEDTRIRSALQCVEELYYTTFYGVYRGFKSILDKAGLKLLEMDIDFEKDGNSDKISKFMSQYETMRKNFKQAFKDYEDDRGDVKVRGGGALADDEDEDYN
jgi:hypothetical protein